MRYREFAESDNDIDDLFAPRPGAPRIAEYINRLADHSDFLDPEEVPVVKAVARAFRQDMRSGLEAFEAMEPTLNNHIYGMVAKNMGIDLYDEAEKAGLDLHESDDMFAPRQAQRIAQYLHSTAHQGDDPELTQTIQGLARAFDQGMQPGLAALKAVDEYELKITLLDEFDDELGIDLEDDYVRIGILESVDMFGQRSKPVLAPTPIGKICADLAQQAHGWAEEARAEGNMEDADWCMEQYQEYIEVAQAFQKSWEQGLARWDQTQDPPRNQLRRAVQDQLNTDLVGAWRDARSKVKESDDLFAERPSTRIAQYLNRPVELRPERQVIIDHLVQAFRKSMQTGLEALHRIGMKDAKFVDAVVQSIEDDLGIDLVSEYDQANLSESNDLFARSRTSTGRKPVRPARPRLSAPILDRRIMGYIPVDSVQIEGIDYTDPTDLANVYVGSATFADGTPLNDAQLERLTDELDRRGFLLEIVGEIWHDWAETYGEV